MSDYGDEPQRVDSALEKEFLAWRTECLNDSNELPPAGCAQAVQAVCESIRRVAARAGASARIGQVLFPLEQNVWRIGALAGSTGGLPDGRRLEGSSGRLEYTTAMPSFGWWSVSSG